MKKIILILSIMLSITVIESFAQTQVKGLETRRIIYDGPSYPGGYRYYGWEITNHNSITVSVEVELWTHENNNKIVKTQEIILKPKESYIFKREEHNSTWVDGYSDYPISSYYLKCYAYKLN